MATIASLNVLLGINSAQFQRGMQASSRTVQRFQATSQRSFRAVNVAYTALAATFAAGALTRGITEASDTITNIGNQLRAAGVQADQLAGAQSNVAALADATRSSLEATGGLYARVLRSSRELGVSQEQALQITRAFQQSLALSGAEVSEAQAASLQFGQALASGRLQGDELRSILENNSFFAQSLARELGVGVGQLREMGRLGQLSSELLADVALKIAPDINRQFGSLTATFGQAGTVLRNRVTLAAADLGTAIREVLPDVVELAREIGDSLAAGLREAARWIRVLGMNGEAVNVILQSTAAIIGTLLLPRLIQMATFIAGALAQSILFLLSPIGSVIAALVGLSVIGVLAWEPIRETASAVWDRIRIGASQMAANVELLFENLKSGTISIFNGIANGVIEAINFAIRQLNRASNALGQGNVADELGLFGGGSGGNDRITELQNRLRALRMEADAANMSIVTGIGNIGGVLGESVDSVQSLIDQLFGGANGPDLSAPGGPGAVTLPDPTGTGLSTGGGGPLSFSKDQQDRLGQSIFDGINQGLTGVLNGGGNPFEVFALAVVSSLQSELISSLADNFTDAIKEFFSDFDFGGLFGGGGGGFFGGIFHGGGVVPGRTNQEVPILAQAGEVVLTPDQAQALGNSGGQTINQTIQVTGDVTEATRRAVREMSGEIANSTRSHFVEQGVVS